MRIAVVNITGGGISGGYKKYLDNLLPRISRHHDVEAVLCASPHGLADPTMFEAMENVTFADCKPFSLFGSKDTDLHNQLDRFRPDVVFVPLERYFRHRDTPTVCMFQNMLPLVPIKHSGMVETLRNKVQKAVAYKAAKGSQRLIAISGFVSEFMQREWQIPAERIGMVYHGVSALRDDESKLPATVSPEWAGNFIFAAGSIESYRGLEDIIRAVHHLKKSGMDERLIIAGSARSAMKPYYAKLQRLVDQLDIRRNVCWAGMLSEKEMAWCYRHARIFVMSSRVEACPNTALEAMSYGNQVISTDVPPMFEFFDALAEYYSPGDYVALSDRILTVLNKTTEESSRLSMMTISRALRFSWEETVNRTVNELRMTCNQ